MQAPLIFYTCPMEAFPPLSAANEQGLLAMGGDLCPERLLLAYRSGIFPWYNAGDPILWWSPDPRCVIYPDTFKPSRSLRKILVRGDYKVTFDRDFGRVIRCCAGPRRGQPGTWITRDMEKAYIELHRRGIAHSVETWIEGRLVGGLYGLALGRAFFGESMFSHASNASKVAFSSLMERLGERGFTLVDCQVSSDHLLSLGAEEIPREEFIARLRDAIGDAVAESHWESGTAASDAGSNLNT